MQGHACRVGARSLLDEITLLAARVHISIPSGNGDAVAPHSDASPAAPDGLPGPTEGSDAPTHTLGLTARELGVLRLLVHGSSNRTIGAELFISPKAVSVHVSHILAELGVAGRGEAVAVAHRLGLSAGRR